MAGYADEKDALVRRLHRIEGQVRGIERMVDEERPCIDVVTQVAAVRTALEQVALKLLESHVRTCMREGGDASVEELLGAVERFVRTR